VETPISVTNVADTTADSGRAVLCPGCGYDLRGTTGERCSECGLAIDRAALERSGFPWAHRASLGRMRAFLKTVWLVTVDAASLRYEVAKQQRPRDGASFRRWVAVALGACFAAVLGVVIAAGGIRELAVGRAEFLSGALPRWTQDFVVPWSAGVVIPPALFLYSTVFAFYVAGVPRSIFRSRGSSEDHRQTVKAISGYVVAPLLLFLPATAGYVLIYFLEGQDKWARWRVLATILAIGSFILVLAAVAGTVWRTGQWRARTAHAGYPTGFGGMAELLLRWALGAAVILGVIPWCVGFLWIVFDSFRR
jgi:hypothetical protein